MCHLNPMPCTNRWLKDMIFCDSRTAWNELFSPSKARSPNLTIMFTMRMSSWQNNSVRNMLNLRIYMRVILRSVSTKLFAGNSIRCRYAMINIIIYLQ